MHLQGDDEKLTTDELGGGAVGWTGPDSVRAARRVRGQPGGAALADSVRPPAGAARDPGHRTRLSQCRNDGYNFVCNRKNDIFVIKKEVSMCICKAMKKLLTPPRAQPSAAYGSDETRRDGTHCTL